MKNSHEVQTKDGIKLVPTLKCSKCMIGDVRDGSHVHAYFQFYFGSVEISVYLDKNSIPGDKFGHITGNAEIPEIAEAAFEKLDEAATELFFQGKPVDESLLQEVPTTTWLDPDGPRGRETDAWYERWLIGKHVNETNFEKAKSKRRLSVACNIDVTPRQNEKY